MTFALGSPPSVPLMSLTPTFLSQKLDFHISIITCVVKVFLAIRSESQGSS